MENRCEEIIRPTVPDRWRQSTTRTKRERERDWVGVATLRGDEL